MQRREEKGDEEGKPEEAWVTHVFHGFLSPPSKLQGEKKGDILCDFGWKCGTEQNRQSRREIGEQNRFECGVLEEFNGGCCSVS